MVSNYAFVDHGMYLSENTLRILAEKACDISREDWEEDKYAVIEELVEMLGEETIEYVSQFSGAAIPVLPNGEFAWGMETEFDDDTVYYVPLARQPNLFTSAYSNVKEVIEEVKGKIGKYLPRSFDYNLTICKIAGTYWCD